MSASLIQELLVWLPSEPHGVLLVLQMPWVPQRPAWQNAYITTYLQGFMRDSCKLCVPLGKQLVLCKARDPSEFLGSWQAYAWPASQETANCLPRLAQVVGAASWDSPHIS